MAEFNYVHGITVSYKMLFMTGLRAD